MESGELLVRGGKVLYTLGVTSDELWRRVGRLLRDARERERLKPYDIQKRGGPDLKTIVKNEGGKISTVKSLDAHADVLGLTVVGLLRSVLAETPISPEAAAVLEAFQETDVAGRQAFLHVAQAVYRPRQKTPPERTP